MNDSADAVTNAPKPSVYFSQVASPAPQATFTPTPDRVTLTIHKQEDMRKDSIERPASAKDGTLGWKVYIDANDEEDAKKRIDAIRRLTKYAAGEQ